MQTLNARSAKFIEEADDDYNPYRKPKKFKNKLCPELDNIGQHVYDETGVCKYCHV